MRRAERPADIEPDVFAAMAEREVLAAMLIYESEAITIVDGCINAADFVRPDFAVIFDAITRVYRAGRAVDFTTIGAELLSMNLHNTARGPQGVASVIEEFRDYWCPMAHLEAHVGIVRTSAQTRRAATLASELAGRAAAGAPLDDLQRVAAKINAELAGSAASRMVSAAKGVEGVMERLSRAGEGAGSSVTLGSRALDALTGGASAGQLVIVGARPAMGKTSLAMGAVVAAAKGEREAAADAAKARRVMFVSLEMPESELYGRAVASEARINNQKILRPDLAPMTQDELTAVTAATNRLHGLPFFVFDVPSAKLSAIRAEAKREHARSPLLMLVVDYLQLVLPEQRSDNREREVAEVSRGLKSLAKELGIPVVALSQLSRTLESRKDKRPMLSDLRESGAVEQDADIVLFVYRDEVYDRETKDRGIAEVIVAKQRNGPCDTVRLRFVVESTRFEDTDAEPVEFSPRASVVHARTPGPVSAVERSGAEVYADAGELDVAPPEPLFDAIGAQYEEGAA